jgi:hypothetical protein
MTGLRVRSAVVRKGAGGLHAFHVGSGVRRVAGREFGAHAVDSRAGVAADVRVCMTWQVAWIVVRWY